MEDYSGQNYGGGMGGARSQQRGEYNPEECGTCDWQNQPQDPNQRSFVPKCNPGPQPKNVEGVYSRNPYALGRVDLCNLGCPGDRPEPPVDNCGKPAPPAPSERQVCQPQPDSGCDTCDWMNQPAGLDGKSFVPKCNPGPQPKNVEGIYSRNPFALGRVDLCNLGCPGDRPEPPVDNCGKPAPPAPSERQVCQPQPDSGCDTCDWMNQPAGLDGKSFVPKCNPGPQPKNVYDIYTRAPFSLGKVDLCNLGCPGDRPEPPVDNCGKKEEVYIPPPPPPVCEIKQERYKDPCRRPMSPTFQILSGLAPNTDTSDQQSCNSGPSCNFQGGR